MKLEDIRIGASEVAPALGLSPYQSRYTWWARKTGRIDNDEGNSATALGNAFEEPVARLFERAHGCLIWKGSDMRHPALPWMAATPDYLCDAEDMPAAMKQRLDVEDGEVLLLEIKTTGLANWRPFDVLKREWGEDGSDAIPLHYATQVQQQIVVVDAALKELGLGFCRRAIVKALIPGRGVPEFVVDGNPEVQAFLRSALESVVEQNLVADIAPPPDEEEDWRLREQFAAAQRRVNGKTLREATDDEIAIVDNWRRARGLYETAKTEAAEARTLLCEAIGDSYGLTGPFGRITYSAGSSTPSLRKAAAFDEVLAYVEGLKDENRAFAEHVSGIAARHTRSRRTGARLTPRFLDEKNDDNKEEG